MAEREFRVLAGSICGTALFLGGLIFATCRYQCSGWVFTSTGAFFLGPALLPLAGGKRERTVMACVVVGTESFITDGFLGLAGEQDLCRLCAVLGVLLMLDGAAAGERCVHKS